MEYFIQSEEGPDVLYHLAKNPAQLAQIMQMTQLNALRELTRIEERLSKAPPLKSQTKAPEPIKPVGSSEKSSFNADDASYAEPQTETKRTGRKRKA